MNENGDILKSLGELTGLVKASREDIATLSTKHDKLATSTQEIATAVRVMQIGYDAKAVACSKEFTEINDKLTRDYKTINELKTKTVVEAGVDDYKGSRRIWWQWALGIIGAILCVITGINQLTGLIQKVEISKITPQTAYGAALVSVLKDTTSKKIYGMKDTSFIITTDTIKGK